MTICTNCGLLQGQPGHAYSIATPMCRCSAPIEQNYWRMEAERYAANTDYWRQKYNDLAEKVAVASEAFCGFPDGAASSSNAGGSCVTAGETAPSHTVNTTHKVAVATDTYWQPIDTCPRGVKVQLLGKGNVATYGTYFGDQFWTHWCPLPKKVTT